MSKIEHPLVRFRKRQDPPLTQEALAKLIGVEGMTVYRWEARRATPQPQHWDKLVKVTKIPIAEILAARGALQTTESAA